MKRQLPDQIESCESKMTSSSKTKSNSESESESAVERMEYSASQNTTQEFLKELNELRQQNCFCDVKIIVEDEVFPCHRNVLSSGSAYFKTMFGGTFKESKTNAEVKMHDIEASIFEQLLNFMYVGRVVIDKRNVSNLLITSEYLGLKYVEDLCLSYIDKHFPVNNIARLLAFALKTEKVRLSNMLYKYIAENFANLSKSDELTQLSPDSLMVILSHPNFQPNLDIPATFLSQWLKCNNNNNNMEIEVSRSKCAVSDLNVHVQEVLPFMDKEWHFLNFITLEYKEEIDGKSKFRVCVHSYTPDSIRKSKLLSTVTNEFSKTFTNVKYVYLDDNIMYSFLQNESWTSIAAWNILREAPSHTLVKGNWSVPNECKFDTTIMASIRPWIYFYDPVVNGKNLNRVLVSYDCERNLWFPMGEQKNIILVKEPCMVSLNNNLYLIGGSDHYNCRREFPTDSGGLVQHLDPRTSRWNKLPNSLYEHIDAATCIYDGKIYISGGKYLSYLEKGIEVFDPVASKWNALAPMPVSKQGHSLVSYKKHIYAVGGFRNDLSVCVYNVEENKWIDKFAISNISTENFKILKIFDAKVF